MKKKLFYGAQPMRPAGVDPGMEKEGPLDLNLAAEGLGGICVLIQLRG